MSGGGDPARPGPGGATMGGRPMDGAATARWLGESGELVSRYGAAVGEHVGRMATVNADLRRELAGARDECGRLRRACGAALAALRSGYRSPHPLDFYRGTDPELHDYVGGEDAARAAKLLADALERASGGGS